MTRRLNYAVRINIYTKLDRNSQPHIRWTTPPDKPWAVSRQTRQRAWSRIWLEVGALAQGTRAVIQDSEDR